MHVRLHGEKLYARQKLEPKQAIFSLEKDFLFIFLWTKCIYTPCCAL